ncbi:hypothetical protein PQO03_13145 [Lentisphaera profundi]|uniref:Uncharacterized protein n=1 Tax=Lentisphaera profundi TaxID=1658616 RepID=A0ABY7VYI4_9BACT|nr:hypothetical protein [Lentisphaera profundi]WDE98782.1 hypothetical protein PQO03_13145 [Lentisphaera profundi]
MTGNKMNEMMIIGLGERAGDLISDLPKMNNFAKLIALREQKRYSRESQIKTINLKERMPWRELWIPEGGIVVLSDLDNLERGEDLLKLSKKLNHKKVIYLLIRPHRLEGDLKLNRANKIIEKLVENKSAVLCLDDEVLISDMSSSLDEAFTKMKSLIAQSVGFFVDMLREMGPVKINLNDLRYLLKDDYGVVNFAHGKGRRINDSVEDLWSSKLLGKSRDLADVGLLYMRMGSAHGDLNVLHDLGTTVELACPENCQFLRAYGEGFSEPEDIELWVALIRINKLEATRPKPSRAPRETMKKLSYDEDLMHMFLRHENTAGLMTKLKVPTYKRLGIKVEK